MCLRNRGLTRREFLLSLVAIGTKIIRSAFFNVLMLFLGFVLGFGTMHVLAKNDYISIKSKSSLRNIEKNLSQQKELNEKIEAEVYELKTELD